MRHITLNRAAAVIASIAVASPLFSGPALAANTTSQGHGVKCTWVLVSSVNGVNTYQQICRKGV